MNEVLVMTIVSVSHVGMPKGLGKIQADRILDSGHSRQLLGRPTLRTHEVTEGFKISFLNQNLS